jgi:hypothetical protein
MVPGTAVLDLDKLTFKPPWTDLTYSIHSVKETEISFSVDNDMISSSGTLNRLTGRLDYSTILHPNNLPPGPLDRWSGVCKPAKPLF